MKNKPSAYIIGTPIGNLADISERVIESINKSDVIFAEDTRTAMAFLSYLKIKKRVISCHKDNERSSAAKVLNEINQGNIISVISEAGMPCISDPGSEVVKTLINNHIPFEIISGPTALIHALIASGFSGGPFFFYGFLPHKLSEKKQILQEIKNIYSPIIFYESPHRITDTLKALLDFFPAPIAVCRELTKIHEETIFINTHEDIETLTLKGEFVIVVNNIKQEKDNNNSYMIINSKKAVKDLLNAGFSVSDVSRIMKTLGMKRNDVYKIAVENAPDALNC